MWWGAHGGPIAVYKLASAQTRHNDTKSGGRRSGDAMRRSESKSSASSAAYEDRSKPVYSFDTLEFEDALDCATRKKLETLRPMTWMSQIFALLNSAIIRAVSRRR